MKANQTSSSSSPPLISNRNHPLFHLAIVEKFQRRIPYLLTLITLIGESYEKLKSSSSLIASAMGSVENRMLPATVNLIENYLPKKPVQMVDHIACRGFELVESSSMAAIERGKQIAEQISHLPQGVWNKIQDLKVEMIGGDEHHSPPLWFRWLDTFLTFIEQKMDKYWPMEKHPVMVTNGDLNRARSGEKPKIHPNLNRLIGRIVAFSEHFQLHLVDFLHKKRVFWFIMSILNQYRKPKESLGKTVASPIKMSSNIANKVATANISNGDTVTNLTTNKTSNENRDQSNLPSPVKEDVSKLAESMEESFQKQALAVVDQIVGSTVESAKSTPEKESKIGSPLKKLNNVIEKVKDDFRHHSQ